MHDCVRIKETIIRRFFILFISISIGSKERFVTKRKREPTMPRRSLKVVGNHLHRCNNSSPRYARENHYAILARMKVSQVFTYKISITLLIFQYVIDRLRLSNHKVNNIIPNPNYINPTKSSHCLQIITYSFRVLISRRCREFWFLAEKCAT